MTPTESISRSAAHLDDAVEALTFDRADWAMEELWHGVAWLHNATSAAPQSELALPSKGEMPLHGALDALVAATRAWPDLVALVAQIEAMLLDGERASAGARGGRAHLDRLATAVFDAGALLDVVAEKHGLAERETGFRRHLAGPLLRPTAVESAVGLRSVRRRDALRLIAAGSAMTLAACTRAERPTEVAPESVEGAPAAQPSVAAATIRAVTALEGLNWPTSDPFLFCAHHVDDYPAGNELLGPAASLDGRVLGRDFEGRDNWRMYHGEQIPGFPRHPHRGFETVTVVRTGLLDHSDSMGATARYGGGDVQWLTAGGGIQHAEMFPLLRADAGNPLELFQIWLNLPARDKMVTPYFTMLWAEQIPRVALRDANDRSVELTIAAGEYNGQRPPAPPPNSWASQAGSDLAIWSLKLEAGATFDVPAVAVGTERSLYVHRGEGVRIGLTDVANLRRVELEGNGPLTLTAGIAEAEILLLQAQPIGESVARRGPFVMNTQEEIRQAYADYQQTGFGGWPWSADAPVHDRTRTRFARRPDGTVEEPS